MGVAVLAIKEVVDELCLRFSDGVGGVCDSKVIRCYEGGDVGEDVSEFTCAVIAI